MKIASVVLIAVFCTLVCSGSAGLFDHSNVIKLDSSTFKEKVRSFKLCTILNILE